MRRVSFRKRAGLWAVTLAVSSAFGLASGCDPVVKSTVLGGAETLASSLVSAILQGVLIDNGITPTASIDARRIHMSHEWSGDAPHADRQAERA